MSGYPRFPLFLDLTGQKVVLVGGGKVALRRARTLQQCGADVVVIAPTLHPDMPTVTHISRPYRPGDLEGATLAVAATDCSDTNRQVAQEAKGRGIPVSVADDPTACTFSSPPCAWGKGWWQGWWATAPITPKPPGPPDRFENSWRTLYEDTHWKPRQSAGRDTK